MAEELLHSEAGQRWLPLFKKIFDDGRDDTSEPGQNLVFARGVGEGGRALRSLLAAPEAQPILRIKRVAMSLPPRQVSQSFTLIFEPSER